MQLINKYAAEERWARPAGAATAFHTMSSEHLSITPCHARFEHHTMSSHIWASHIPPAVIIWPTITCDFNDHRFGGWADEDIQTGRPLCSVPAPRWISEYAKYADMQICKYANMQICKYANMQISTSRYRTRSKQSGTRQRVSFVAIAQAL